MRMIPLFLASLTLVSAVALAGCGKVDDSGTMKTTEEVETITSAVVKGENLDYENPAGSVNDFDSVKSFIDESLKQGNAKSGTAEALDVLSGIAGQTAKEAADPVALAKEARDYLKSNYPDYLKDKETTESVLYYAFCLLGLTTNDKDSADYTLGMVVSHTVEPAYLGLEKNEDVQEYINNMGTQFFEAAESAANTAADSVADAASDVVADEEAVDAEG